LHKIQDLQPKQVLQLFQGQRNFKEVLKWLDTPSAIPKPLSVILKDTMQKEKI